MRTEATTVSKRIDASARKHRGKGVRGLYDSAAKGIISTRSILAWIVKSCVRGAESLTIETIATQCIAPEITVSAVPIRRDDADAQAKDPGIAHMESTEDSSVSEGVVRYDILFTLKLPGQSEPITVIVNVELQNRVQPDYPLASCGVCYAARLLGRQGTDYGNLQKSIFNLDSQQSTQRREEHGGPFSAYEDG